MTVQVTHPWNWPGPRALLTFIIIHPGPLLLLLYLGNTCFLPVTPVPGWRSVLMSDPTLAENNHLAWLRARSLAQSQAVGAGIRQNHRWDHKPSASPPHTQLKNVSQHRSALSTQAFKLQPAQSCTWFGLINLIWHTERNSRQTPTQPCPSGGRSKPSMKAIWTGSQYWFCSFIHKQGSWLLGKQIERQGVRAPNQSSQPWKTATESGRGPFVLLLISCNLLSSFYLSRLWTKAGAGKLSL